MTYETQGPPTLARKRARMGLYGALQAIAAIMTCELVFQNTELRYVAMFGLNVALGVLLIPTYRRWAGAETNRTAQRSNRSRK